MALVSLPSFFVFFFLSIGLCGEFYDDSFVFFLFVSSQAVHYLLPSVRRI